MVAARGRGDADTASRILDVAERLAQVRGFNGFSYADVAVELHLTKAALHYHFASKAELGVALLRRYSERFASALEEIQSLPVDAPAKLDAYADLYLEALHRDRMCLCGMMAAEYQTLPAAMQAGVKEFFVDNEAWLTTVLAQGGQEGSIRLSGSIEDAARMVVAGLEGAALVAGPFHDSARFRAVSRTIIDVLSTAATA